MAQVNEMAVEPAEMVPIPDVCPCGSGEPIIAISPGHKGGKGVDMFMDTVEADTLLWCRVCWPAKGW